MAALPCRDCGAEAKMKNNPRCVECWLARQPADVVERLRRARLDTIPDAVRKTRVPERAWPPGRRWCAGCQSFPRLRDCSGSRCRACASATRHAAGVTKDFGITGAEYAALLRAQGGRCAICKSAPRSKRMAVDHDHKLVGRASVRGLLCGRCNHDLLGAAHDSVDVLRAAVTYLESPPARRLFSS